MIENAARLPILGLEQQQVERLKQREVTVDLDLEEMVGESRAVANDALRSLGILEAQQAGFRQRVDGDDVRAILLRLLQRDQHARMIRAWVLAGNDDELGLVEVVQSDAALADADRLRQRGTARFVAHV